MNNFVHLYFKLEECEELTLKIKYIVQYLKRAPVTDAELVIWLLNANKFSSIINTAQLKKWILIEAGLPEWLYNESQDFVKDAEETLALIIEPGNQECSGTVKEWIDTNIVPLKSMRTEQQRIYFLQQFLCLRKNERLLYLKLLTGKIKFCVNKKTVVKALSTFSQLDEEIINYRLSQLNEQQGFYEKLFEQNGLDLTNCRPYPFMIADQLEEHKCNEFNPADCIAEWKWRGVRIQILIRASKVYIWSKTHEFLSDKFPDLVEELLSLNNDVVLDGQLICADGTEDAVNKRLSNKLTPGIINKYPVKFIAFDVLEYDGEDLRNKTLFERKKTLKNILCSHSYKYIQEAEYFQLYEYSDVHKLTSGINYNYAEGLLIKDAKALYNNDFRNWYAIKKKRSSINAVLLYIQRDYQNYEPGGNTIKIMTFGVPDRDTFVSVAKTDCNLSSSEITELEKYIKENTIERVGPIRVLNPRLIFELTFEEILLSKRHKSGVNIISPQISSWKKDLSVSEIQDINFLKNLTCC